MDDSYDEFTPGTQRRWSEMQSTNNPPGLSTPRPSRDIEMSHPESVADLYRQVQDSLQELYAQRDAISVAWDEECQRHSHRLDDLNTRIAMAEAATQAYANLQPDEAPLPPAGMGR